MQQCPIQDYMYKSELGMSWSPLPQAHIEKPSSPASFRTITSTPLHSISSDHSSV